MTTPPNNEALAAARKQFERISNDEPAPDQDAWATGSPNAWARDTVVELNKQLSHWRRIADEAIDNIDAALASEAGDD